jgi:predicted ArsR family transcriptional regulator
LAVSDQDAGLEERLHELVAAGGVTAKYSALAARLGVGEEAVRRAAQRLTRAGRVVASPAGRQGVRLVPGTGTPRTAARGRPAQRAGGRTRAKFCPYCGRKADNDWTYCADCGKKLPR